MSVYTTIRCKCIVAKEYRELMAEVLENPYSNIMFEDRVINTIMEAAIRFTNYFFGGSDDFKDGDGHFTWQEPIDFKYDRVTGEWYFMTEVNHLDDEEQMFFELFVPRYIEKVEFYESYIEFIHDAYEDGKNYDVSRVVEDRHKIVTYNGDAYIHEVEACMFSDDDDTKLTYNLPEEDYWKYVESKGHMNLFKYMDNKNAKYVQYDVLQVENMIRIQDDTYYLDSTNRCKEIFGEAVVKEAWIALDVKEVFRFKRPLNAADMQKKISIMEQEEQTELLAEVERQIQYRGVGKYFKNIANYILGERGRIEVGSYPYDRKMIKELRVIFGNDKSMIIDPCGVRM